MSDRSEQRRRPASISGLLLAFLVLGACASAPERRAAVPSPEAPLAAAATSDSPGAPPRAAQAAEDPIPNDSAVRSVVLDNGLTLYVRANHRPENRAELRLVVRAGSVLEDEDQLGLAHFVEHMAFNGTRHFAKQELVESLRAIGMRFGADLNASTGFDQTIYQLQVPLDDPDVVDRALLVLGDWAHEVTFESEEIERERGVVLEEWRGGRGAGARVRDRELPVIYAGSRYAERLPIGDPEVLQSFPREALVRYYRDWYRPDLMAVIAVGDFDPDAWLERLETRFATLLPRAEPREHFEATVPPRSETATSRVTDPELTTTSVRLLYRFDAQDTRTVGDFRRDLVESLFTSMLNARLRERLQEAEPPFLGAFVSSGRLSRERGTFTLGATVEEDAVAGGFRAVLEEAERARRFGFLDSELERTKTQFLRAYERSFEERDKTESRVFVSRLIGNFLDGQPYPSAEARLRLLESLLPGIELAEVSAVGRQWMSSPDRILLASGPEKEGFELPPAEELIAAVRAMDELELEPWVDRVAQTPLLASLPDAGEIVERSRWEDVGVTVWRLSNGARVLLKETDFKNDEIRFTAFSPGGHSLVPDEDYVAASTATSVLGLGGLGDHSLIELRKLLAGKAVGVSPYIGELEEGLSGGGSLEDVETLFQLLYLQATAPRRDAEAFQSFLTRMRGFIANRLSRPEAVFGDVIATVMSQNHFRRRPISEEILAETDLDRSYEIYRERFADFSDFTFVFVGSFASEQLEPLVERYVASLPGLGRSETWRDIGLRPPRGVIERTVRKGLEPKAQVRLIFTGPFDAGSRLARHRLASMADVLRDRLREKIREDEGGTYGVSVGAGSQRAPVGQYSLTVGFGCAPERVESLTADVLVELERLRSEPASADEIREVQETQRREREEAEKENGFWLSSLEYVARWGEAPREILTYEERIGSLDATAILEMARATIDFDNYARFVLLPEETAAAGGDAAPQEGRR